MKISDLQPIVPRGNIYISFVLQYYIGNRGAAKLFFTSLVSMRQLCRHVGPGNPYYLMRVCAWRQLFIHNLTLHSQLADFKVNFSAD